MDGRVTLAVRVLGTAGMFQTPERAASGYLLTLGDHHLWLDAGSGTWQRLLEHIDYAEIDGVMLTHRHPDHVTDLFQAYHARLFGPRGDLPVIPLWAPIETIDVVRSFAPEIERAFELRDVRAGGALEWNGTSFRFTEMAHPPETVGVRVEREGAVVAYSADTGRDAEFSALAQDADVFICEATYQDSDEEWEGHLRASSAAEIAAECSVGKLLLTHLPPERDLELSVAEAKRVAAELDVVIAEDGGLLEVTS